MVSQDSFEEESGSRSGRLAGLDLSQILWLITLGLIVLFVPLYFVGVALQDDLSSLQTELAPLETALAITPTPVPLGIEAAQTTAVSPTLAAANVNWPAAMNIIRTYNPSQITLTDITQTDNRLLISGQAANDTIVVDYARSLEASGQFKGVLVQSIVAAAPTQAPSALPAATSTITPSATQTAVPTATSTRGPTWTPTSDYRDKYEWDDSVASPIYLNDTQTHNFYPTFDVDHVTFLAKAGRAYRVYTLNLAAGVDTFLTVTQGETTLTNDDATFGTLTSQVIVQAPADTDTAVWVRITNRGAYGASMTYQVRVEEVVPTSTPTAIPVTPSTPTTTPSPTNTATSTSIPVPSSIPSATPDLRDQFEPDEEIPALIAVGETQVHTFFPSGDVDRVRFVVKGERIYEVQTGDLPVGIDTRMIVSLDQQTWENDDFALPGSGNFASAVCFATGAEQDGHEAVVSVENVNQQFAADKYYALSVVEQPVLKPDAAALEFVVAADAPEPVSQVVSLAATEVLTWTAVSDTSWLTLDLLTGTTPATLTVSANSSGLAEGVHEGSLTLSWAAACQRQIPVTLTVTAPGSSSLEFDWLAAVKTMGRTAKRTAFQGSGPVEFVIAVELGK